MVKNLGLINESKYMTVGNGFLNYHFVWMWMCLCMHGGQGSVLPSSITLHPSDCLSSIDLPTTYLFLTQNPSLNPELVILISLAGG